MSRANQLLIESLKSFIEEKEKEIGDLKRNNFALRKENTSLKKRLSSQEGFVSRKSIDALLGERLN